MFYFKYSHNFVGLTLSDPFKFWNSEKNHWKQDRLSLNNQFKQFDYFFAVLFFAVLLLNKHFYL